MGFRVACVCDYCETTLGVAVTTEHAREIARVEHHQWVGEGRQKLDFCSEECWAQHHARKRMRHNPELRRTQQRQGSRNP